MTRRRNKQYHEAVARIENEYGMPAVEVIRWEAYTGNYPLKRVASDLGMTEVMLRGILAENNIEWNRQSQAEAVGTMPEYVMHVVGEQA